MLGLRSNNDLGMTLYVPTRTINNIQFSPIRFETSIERAFIRNEMIDLIIFDEAKFPERYILR